MESLLNDMRSLEVHKQYKVSQKDGLQRNPPLKIDNKDERPLVSINIAGVCFNYIRFFL